jgi:hypothetical protein
MNTVAGVRALCIGGRRGGKQIQVYMRKISVANTSNFTVTPTLRSQDIGIFLSVL